jgi:predicted deacylase
MPAPFQIGDAEIAPGTRQTVELPVSVLSDHTPVTLSAHVIHGRKPGPAMFVSAAIHGDEVIGAEIVRRLLRAAPVARLSGTLVTVPIVNSFGFLNQSRYLPDRRDLNRCFPGSAEGSLAGRLADLFLTEVVRRCDVGIDLHSAAVGCAGWAMPSPRRCRFCRRCATARCGAPPRKRAWTSCSTRRARACASTSSRRGPVSRESCG